MSRTLSLAALIETRAAVTAGLTKVSRAAPNRAMNAKYLWLELAVELVKSIGTAILRGCPVAISNSLI